MLPLKEPPPPTPIDIDLSIYLIVFTDVSLSHLYASEKPSTDGDFIFF